MADTSRPLVLHADAGPNQDLSGEAAPLVEVNAALRPTRARDEDGLIANLHDADVVLVSGAPMTRRVMENMPRCRGIVRYGVGLDNVDVPAATDLGIVVAHVLNFCTEEVANHVILLLLACAKKLLVLDRSMRDGRWGGIPAADYPAVFGQTLGIVGLGEIGRSVARKGQALGMEIIAHDPYVKEGAGPLPARLVRLEDLLRQSDYVSLNSPLTKETFHLIGERELALMKPTAVLINTARGPVVDEPALIEALRQGKIAAAGLDVFEAEPLPASSPLLKLDNVILTPHTAGISHESARTVRTEVGKAAADLLAGRWPRYVANRDVRPRVPLR
jgi:D-3-phosphoglycerate dehydrogenase